VLRVAEQWSASDLGRQRQGNEDSMLVRSPLFVLADGMGGAQAGEVASAVAVEAFRSGLPDGAPAEALVHTIEGANRRIHDMSHRESKYAGMGTTCTVAYVTPAEVLVAHVGDSRAYLLRDGDLVRLTRDHSLVSELLARGKLTEEQAEHHPQRSVITRALGPEPSVRVDLDVFGARDGDVFLLCSDGLTDMIPEALVRQLLAGNGSLEEAGRALIRAANEAGGRDNITVIVFRLEDVGDAAAHAPITATHATTAASPDAHTDEQPALDSAITAQGSRRREEAETQRGGDVTPPRGGVRSADLQRDDAVTARGGDVQRGGDVTPPRGGVRSAALRADPDAPTARGTATLEDPATKESERRPAEPPAKPPRRRSRGRRALKVLLIVCLLLAPVLIGGYAASRSVFFLGTDPRDGRTVAIFRGLPYELPGGIELYSRHYVSGVTLDAVPVGRRTTFSDHKLRSLEDAEDLVTALERGQLE
jgi:protein phosphatase